eukprot:TRINITY_DN821_c0_g1_i1.p1 TRINITY_DN821_c0_g1~~TRINITY_DN821_c0_g1_i1.p1  ORF type:complete len:190 (+),score=47.10 TRINITY_DN821_c0_g1_i1:198-767(+)
MNKNNNNNNNYQQKKTPKKNTFSVSPADKEDIGDFQAGYFVMPDAKDTTNINKTKTQRKPASPTKNHQHGSPSKKQHQPRTTNTSPQKQLNYGKENVDTARVTLQEKDSKRWAGPAFGNAPPPSSLPLPDFTSFSSEPTPFVPLSHPQTLPLPNMYYYAPALSPAFPPNLAQLSTDLRKLLNIGDPISV